MRPVELAPLDLNRAGSQIHLTPWVRTDEKSDSTKKPTHKRVFVGRGSSRDIKA
jgi:hypothetical protein